jgi:hypothetical protein
MAALSGSGGSGAVMDGVAMAMNPASRKTLVLPLMLVLLLAAIPIYVFLLNPFQPLIDFHSFRQAQTAITAYWMQQGGDLVHYLTPIMGYPWQIPMEFPLFQAIVAAVSTATGWPLDFTGRLLSLLAYLLTCIPIVLCLRRYGWFSVVVALAVLLSSPVSVYFARAFLMETTATLLAISSLCAYIGFVRTQRPAYLVGFMILGSLAGLQKITTFLPVFGACCIDLLVANFASLRRNQWRAIDWRPVICVALSLVLPAWWTIDSDVVKSSAPLSSVLTSSALREWNFGTLAQRMEYSYWNGVFLEGILIVGGFGVVAVILAGSALRKTVILNREAMLFALSGMLGPLVFANLYIIHPYYQLGCIAFLACAVAIVVAPTLQELSGSKPRFVTVIALLVAFNWSLFDWNFRHMVYSAYPRTATAYTIGKYLKETQDPEDVTVIVGLEYSSVLPYYAGRYALMVTELAPAELRSQLLHHPERFIGDRRVGSVVHCRIREHAREQRELERELLFAQVEGPVKELNGCTVKVRGAPGATGEPETLAFPFVTSRYHALMVEPVDPTPQLGALKTPMLPARTPDP